MKKVIVLLLMVSVMVLGIFGAVSAFADTGAGVYHSVEESKGVGHWFAQPALSGDEWIVSSVDDVYASATFTAAKPFSSIAIPYWAGNPNNFAGIEPGEVEFAIFKAVDGNWGEDYDSKDAIRREVFTTDCDNQAFVWSFDQVLDGRYCLKVTLVKHEQAYFVLNEGDPVDDDIEFDLSTIMGSTQSTEGFEFTVIYDEVALYTHEPTPEPTDTPAPTEAPTEAPADETAEPGDEPTDEPADETAEPADESTAQPADNDPTDKPAVEEPTAEPAKKGCGSIIAGGFALAAAAGAVLLLKKRH
ncbi:MAG: hypothetical protein ILO53_04080 [Clostridia bacterium]|nr:hypothetical protein [Clostridia bacterium]